MRRMNVLLSKHSWMHGIHNSRSVKMNESVQQEFMCKEEEKEYVQGVSG
jgi:hypothetical protein